MPRYIVLILFIAIKINLLGQSTESKSTIWTPIPLRATGGFDYKILDFNANLLHDEAPKPGTKSTSAYLQKQKQLIPAKIYQETANKKGSAPERPFNSKGFRGNVFNGIPNDNSMAVSNNGMIVSVINSTIQVYDNEGNVLKNSDLSAFTASLKLKGNKYDPKMIYDPAQDRFIFVCLNGNYDSTSFIVFAFSQTNDPTGDWNFYQIEGNPLKDKSWSDYPMLSLSDNYVFFTINLLKNGGTWQESFKQTVIWQIDKNSGFKGESLNTKLFSDIQFNGKPLRNICPVKSGSSVNSDKSWFLSNRNFALESDSIFLISIEGEISDNSVKPTIKLLKSDKPYGVAPEAAQPSLNTLQTNDARILDAFIENDRIQFVSNSVNPDNNFAAVFYGVIQNPEATNALTGVIIGSDTLEYGYPGIAYTGNGTDENDAIIVVDFSGKDDFPGCGAFFTDGKDVSRLRVSKNGTGSIDILSEQAERWGDYIGMQRKYNEPGVVWSSATFGLKANQPPFLRYATWIAQYEKFGLNSTTELTKPNYETVLYPNPVANDFNVRFQIENEQYLSFKIYDSQGRLVCVLLEDRVKSGKNIFSFSTHSLPAGIYTFVVDNPVSNQIVAKESIIVSK